MGKSRVIGLDIGTTHVRAAEIEFGSGGPSGSGQPELIRYGQVVLPPGAVKDAEVAEGPTVATALRRLWADAKFSTKDVVIGVGNQRVLVRDLDLPAMPLPQLRSALPFQVQDMIPVAVEDALLDYYPTSSTVGPNGPLVRGLLVAATKETVLANTRAVELAGLRPMMVDLNAFAIARVQARGGLSRGTHAFIDIGARITNLVVVVEGAPRFVRILATGGQDVTDAVAHAMNIGPHDAEVLKREIGVGYAVPPDLDKAKEAVHDVTSALIEGLRNTLMYFSTAQSTAVDQIILTGGGAFLPGFGQYLASATRIQVSLGQPMSTLRAARSSGVPLGDLQPTFAVPLGLAFGVAA